MLRQPFSQASLDKIRPLQEHSYINLLHNNVYQLVNDLQLSSLYLLSTYDVTHMIKLFLSCFLTC